MNLRASFLLACRIAIYALGIPAASLGYAVGYLVGACVWLRRVVSRLRGAWSRLRARKATADDEDVEIPHLHRHRGPDCVECRPGPCGRCGAPCARGYWVGLGSQTKRQIAYERRLLLQHQEALRAAKAKAKQPMAVTAATATTTHQRHQHRCRQNERRERSSSPRTRLRTALAFPSGSLGGAGPGAPAPRGLGASRGYESAAAAGPSGGMQNGPPRIQGAWPAPAPTTGRGLDLMPKRAGWEAPRIDTEALMERLEAEMREQKEVKEAEPAGRVHHLPFESKVHAWASGVARAGPSAPVGTPVNGARGGGEGKEGKVEKGKGRLKDVKQENGEGKEKEGKEEKGMGNEKEVHEVPVVCSP